MAEQRMADRDKVARGSSERRVRRLDLLVISLTGYFALLNVAFARTDYRSVLGVTVDRNLAATLVFVLIGLVVLVVIRACRPYRREPLGFVRVFYVQLLYPVFFAEAIYLSQRVWGGRSFDRIFFEVDQALFGLQPATFLPGSFGHLNGVNEFFYFAYFSYFVIITAGWWRLYVRGRRDKSAFQAAEHALFVVTASFAALYVWYTFFPVWGPKYYIPELRSGWYADLDGYLFAWIMRLVFDNANLAGAAVPSSHVAIALIAVRLNYQHNPRWWARVVFVMTVPLIVSTVYLYAHYVVDVILALPAAVFLYHLSSALYVSASPSPDSMKRAKVG